MVDGFRAEAECVRADKMVEMAGIELEFWAVAADFVKESQAGFEGAEGDWIRDVELDAVAEFVGEFAEHRREMRRPPTDSGQLQGVQAASELGGVDERCADEFEGMRRAAAFGDVGAFKQACSDIDEGAFLRRDVGGWVDPAETCVFELRVPFVVFTWDDDEIAADVEGLVDVTCVFADGKSIACGHRVHAHEGFETVGFQQDAFRDRVAERIDAIEDDDGNVVSGGVLHGVAERIKIGIIARTDVLYVISEQIDLGELFVRNVQRLAVEAIDGNVEDWVHEVFDLLAILRVAADAMFGAEERG